MTHDDASRWLPLLSAPTSADSARTDQPARVSVLIPVYNSAATIGEALESALTQQPPPFEVIVSDDGSSDNLASVLEPFGRHIRVIRGPNAGLAVARNRAASVATGDLLALLDADDVWLPGRVDALSTVARRRPDLDIIATDAVVIRQGVPDEETYYASRTWDNSDQRRSILMTNFIFGASSVRRRAYLKVGGYRAGLRSAEDWDLWIRLLMSGSRAGLVRFPLYAYHRSPTSLTRARLDLAASAVTVLSSASTMDLSEDERETLNKSIEFWRTRQALAAAATGHASRRRLAMSRITAQLSGRQRALLVAGAVLPSRTLVKLGRTPW